MAATSGEVWERLRETIRQRALAGGLPSVAVAVAQGEDILFEVGWGWADREARLPASAHTVYALASISKPITATGLMVLAERGAVDLDAPANDYLGDDPVRAYVSAPEEVSVRRLAGHSAGLPPHVHCFYIDESATPWGGVCPPRGESIRRYGVSVFQPGEIYCYSNLGYGILDHIISRVSGMPFGAFLQAAVFAPLGMMRASVDLAPALEPYAAARYTPSGQRLPDYAFDHPGGSQLWCSAHDLIRFAQFHLGVTAPDQRAILTPTSLEETHRPIVRSSEHAQYALGWRVGEDDAGYRTLGHDGSMSGVSTRLVLVPEQGLAVAVLCNTSTRVHHDISDDILSVLLPGYAERLPERQARAEQAARAERMTLPEELLGLWQGSVHTYQGERLLLLDIRPDEVRAGLDGDYETLLGAPAWQEGTLHGRLLGDLHTEDTEYHNALHLMLRRVGGALCGTLNATAWPTRGERLRNTLGHWTCLERA